MMNIQFLIMEINSTTVAISPENFLREDKQEEINQPYVQRIIEEKNINLIITTRTNEELKFIKDLSIITINNNDDDINTIENSNIEINKQKGNFLYLFDNHNIMLKYMISLKLINNYTSNIQNLDFKTQAIIEVFDLTSFFDSYKSYLSTRCTQIQSANDMSYQLPKPIKIQQTIIKINQNLMN